MALTLIQPESSLQVNPRGAAPSWVTALLCLFCCLAFGVALFSNASGKQQLSGLRLEEALFLNAFGRALATGLACVALLVSSPATSAAQGSAGSAPPSSTSLRERNEPPVAAVDGVSSSARCLCARGAAGSARRAQPCAISATLILSALVGFVGFSSFFTLMARPNVDVSVFAPATGLYSVIPVIFGVLCRGEERTWRKAASISLSFAAIAILGCSSLPRSGAPAEEAGHAAPPLPPAAAGVDTLAILLFATTFACWGASDVLSASAPRALSALDTALSFFISQVITTTAAGFVVLVHSVNAAAATGSLVAAASAVSAIPFGWPHVRFIAANAFAIFGRLAYVRLGQTEDLTKFVPIVSLHTFIPVILALFFLGETLTSTKAAGLVCAIVAVIVASTAPTRSVAALGAAVAAAQPPLPPPCDAKLPHEAAAAAAVARLGASVPGSARALRRRRGSDTAARDAKQ